MARKDYPAAIEAYTKALALVPDNKIYLSNRAAAYSQAGQHRQAASDALRAVEIDPGYAKAWSRLGHARYALGDSKGSMEAYEKGLKCEGGQTDVFSPAFVIFSFFFWESLADLKGYESWVPDCFEEVS